MKKGYLFLILIIFSISCTKQKGRQSDKINVVATTTIFSDLVSNIGGDKVEVTSLMGVGVDPHLFKASEGDVQRIGNADILFYGGLHLEGKLADVFSKMKRLGKNTVNLGESLDKSQLIRSENFGGNYDPHIWFDLDLYRQEAVVVAQTLSEIEVENKDYFENRLQEYLQKLDTLESEILEMIHTLPPAKRKLVTAHDAFSYFGLKYGFEIISIQGISTTAEAGVQDVRRVTNYILEHKVKAVFIESSIPKRSIEAIQNAVSAKGFDVKTGGTLYSDALGNPGTEEGTFIGMFRKNVRTIVSALK